MKRTFLALLLSLLSLFALGGSAEEITDEEAFAKAIQPVPVLVFSIGGDVFYGETADNTAGDVLMEYLGNSRMETELDEAGTGILPWTLPLDASEEPVSAGDLVLLSDDWVQLCLEDAEETSVPLAHIQSGSPEDWRAAFGAGNVRFSLWIEWSE